MTTELSICSSHIAHKLLFFKAHHLSSIYWLVCIPVGCGFLTIASSYGGGKSSMLISTIWVCSRLLFDVDAIGALVSHRPEILKTLVALPSVESSGFLSSWIPIKEFDASLHHCKIEIRKKRWLTEKSTSVQTEMSRRTSCNVRRWFARTTQILQKIHQFFSTNVGGNTWIGSRRMTYQKTDD